MSVTKQCRDLNVGDSAYIEADTIEQSHNITRRMNLAARLPVEMKAWKFKCITYTAIALQGGDIVYINKVTRTK
jgi:hypothetical protein